MRRVLLAGVGALLMLSACGLAGCDPAGGGGTLRPGNPSAKAEPKVVPNDMCYVCHIPFAKEPLAVVHAKAKVWCIKCHGPSAGHMQDEDVGATPADIAYEKHQVDPMCSKSGCHEPEKHPLVNARVRFGRLRYGRQVQEEIKGRPVEVTGVCTDCHGRHWIPPRD